MSKYLKTKGCSNLAIAVCPRCKFKVKYEDLVKDPNTQQMVCPECQDQLDPYRLPARAGDRFNLQYPRPDEDLEISGIEEVILEDGSFWITDGGEFVIIDDEQITI